MCFQEWLHGINLRQLIEAEGRASEVTTCMAMLDVLDGLHAMHQVGLFHLRVRPASIMRITQRSGRIVHKLVEIVRSNAISTAA